MDKEFSARLPPDKSISRGEEIIIYINGNPTTAYVGESVASVLICEEIYAMRTTVAGDSRGVFCGMGVCFDCLVVVDQVPNTRACMTLIQSGMKISTQDGLKASQ